MKAKDVIALLSTKLEAEVLVERTNNDGCDTCGWGASTTEYDLEVVDLESRFVIRVKD